MKKTEMDRPPEEVSMAVNKLFILASLQEDVMMSTPLLTMKHEIKYKFNKIFNEVKKLNKLINNTMDEEGVEAFDLITNEINLIFKRLEGELEK